MYICTRKCWHGERLWKEGETFKGDPKLLPRNKKRHIIHFEPVEDPPEKDDGEPTDESESEGSPE